MNSRYLVLSFLWAGALFGTPPEKKHSEEYLQVMIDYLESIGSVGDAEKGEIEILKDPKKLPSLWEKRAGMWGFCSRIVTGYVSMIL